jgi:hypothetical protein
MAAFLSPMWSASGRLHSNPPCPALDGRTLVLAPPVLIDRENPGSWPNVFLDFGVRQADFESVGKLDHVLLRGTERYKNVIIDEAHRFRNEMTQSYESLYRICRASG